MGISREDIRITEGASLRFAEGAEPPAGMEPEEWKKLNPDEKRRILLDKAKNNEASDKTSDVERG